MVTGVGFVCLVFFYFFETKPNKNIYWEEEKMRWKDCCQINDNKRMEKDRQPQLDCLAVLLGGFFGKDKKKPLKHG